MKERFYITTPIYYPNARPHMGHAYATLLCDAIARYHRFKDEEVYFMTGTDENTEKVVQAAEKVGEDPQEYLIKIVKSFKDLYAQLDISYDQFIRTTDADVHWPGVIEMWNRLEKRGDLYKGAYEGLYCVGCEAFLTEKDLVDGKCPNHGTEPTVLREENYFFRLSAYTNSLKELIENGTIKITPATRRGEILAFIEQGLADISFSRPAKSIPWGIPVPGDDSQRMYVWMDALTNYITGLGFGRGEENMRFWPGMHVLGKDILRFHAAIWPAMLLSAGLPLPKELLVHGMIISDGKKMSKSLGNVIDPIEILSQYGTDATRLLLLKHIHPTEDTDITYERLDEWYTADLVNGLGNQVARIMKLAQTHLSSPVTVPEEAHDLDQAFLDAFDAFNLNAATETIWERIREIDEYIQTVQPFKLVKSESETDREEGKKVIEKLVVHLARIATHLEPFMPQTAAKIHESVRSNTMPEALFPRLQ